MTSCSLRGVEKSFDILLSVLVVSLARFVVPKSGSFKLIQNILDWVEIWSVCGSFPTLEIKSHSVCRSQYGQPLLGQQFYPSLLSLIDNSTANDNAVIVKHFFTIIVFLDNIDYF